jgi:hypothetical protein
MPYCTAHRPLPERCSYVSRYAVARTIAVAVTAASFAGGVIIPPLLKANQIVAHVKAVSCCSTCQAVSNGTQSSRDDMASGPHLFDKLNPACWFIPSYSTTHRA